MPPSYNFNVTGSFGSSTTTIRMQGNVVFGQTPFNGCPYSLCTWVYGAGATLNISLQGTAGTDYAIDITRTATMSVATADPIGAYSARADSTSADTKNGPPSASFSTVSTVRGTGSITTTVSLGAGVGFRQTYCRASDSQGCLGDPIGYPGGGSGNVDYTLTIVARLNNPPPPSLSCPSGSGTKGVAYASAFAASGGTPPYTSFGLSSGSLPPGLTLNPSSGSVTGSPTIAGTYPFTGAVTDTAGRNGTASCSITIAPPPPPTISCPSPSGTMSVYCTSAFNGSGGSTPYSFSLASGGLPPGVTLNSSTGSVAGVPLSDGTFTFTGLLLDAAGQTASTNCTLDIGGGQCSIAPLSSLGFQTTAGNTGTCRQNSPIRTNGCGPYPQFFLSAALRNLALTNPAAAQAASCMDQNNPACGKNTSFANVLKNGPCDIHDYCYTTCYKLDPDDPLNTYEGHKSYCDFKFHEELVRVCTVAKALGQDPQPVLDACDYLAEAYAFAVGSLPISWLSYNEDQKKACLCCPGGTTDGTIGPAGGTVTDSLFGSRAKLVAPSGVLPSPTAATIDVLPASLNVTFPQGLSLATYFTTITLMPPPSGVLAAPGLRVDLPILGNVIPGAKIILYRVTGGSSLVPETGVSGNPVTGVVDTQAFAATFQGIGSFSTMVGLSMLGDLNADLKVDCADIAVVRAAFGKNATQTGFDAHADVNFDGVVDIRDLSFVSQKLPTGTRCQ